MKEKKLLFIIVLCTWTKILKQMIENLHAHVQIVWKILLALIKSTCICASVHVQNRALGLRKQFELQY